MCAHPRKAWLSDCRNAAIIIREDINFPRIGMVVPSGRKFDGLNPIIQEGYAQGVDKRPYQEFLNLNGYNLGLINKY